jgi:acetylornithine deacetylase/succinyl-diaminopimelate desuccinylase-like protein
MDIDWEKEGVEAVERLREMIRFATVNPPGDEKKLVEWLAGTLRQEGLEPEVIVPEAARANLAVTVKGDGSERPLLLLSHLDVVPVETERWTSPPFAGELRDGFVYGRGAIDSKLTGAVQLQVLLMCHRLGLRLKRDLYWWRRLTRSAEACMGWSGWRANGQSFSMRNTV